MAHARDNDMREILVIDLESTCWEGSPPEGEVPDITEIGVAVLDVRTLEIARSESILVRPTRSEVSEFCTKLTGHTTEELHEHGRSLPEAFERLVDGFKSRARPWASWGAYDRKMIEKTAADFKLTSPVTRQHINVKTLFALVHGLAEVPMDVALNWLRWPLEGRHHNGRDDAVNIARMLSKMLGDARRIG